MLKNRKILTGLMMFFCLFGSSHAECYVDGESKGNISAEIVGIEYQDSCTFLLLKSSDIVVTNFAGSLDTNPFQAGRFYYLSLDPSTSNPEKYKYILSLATTAMVTKTRIYAEFTSRTGRIDKFSLSSVKGQ